MAAPAQAHPAAIDPADYQRVELAKGVDEMGEPLTMAVLPDLSVLHTSRDGTLRRTDATGDTSVVGALNVYTHDEEGLQGVAADPGFATNRFIYLYYAPRLDTPAGDAPATGTDFSAWQGVNRLSRFTVKPDWTLDMSSEVKVLDVPADRGICCHVGGDIDFDAAGNLYLSTGDDTNPFDSAGYSPIDERTDRNPAYDAQRSSGNTDDLRGKILRIKVNPDGTYDVPEGNLFPPGTENTRPEIYAMGFRNPYRLSVDKTTGIVYVGDYGPDAGSSDPNRGPSGQVEFNRVTGPGNYGWPYCTGTNTLAETYNEYTFPSGPAGQKYDCATGGPVNNSFRNTGLPKLPPAQPAWIKYGGDSGSPPEFGGGSESPMGGPVYHYDADLKSAVKLPEDMDGHFFAGEFGRQWIKAIDVNADGTAGAISDFPWTGTQVMDMAIGPDGALYVLDYGSGYFGGDENSAVYRIEYIKGRDRSPVAVAEADKTSGKTPLTVTFSSEGSADPEGAAITYAWDFGDDTTSTDANPVKTYTDDGTYTATLTVSDPAGNTGTASVQITVGNTAPTVTLETPAEGRLFQWGDTVPFTVKVTDPEEPEIDCEKVTVTYVLGHDGHGHQISSENGCSGELTIPVDGEHDDAANIFAVFDASYTDKGGLTTKTQHILQPRHRQAEHYTAMSGVSKIDKAPAHGGRTVGDINNGEWISFKPYELSDAKMFTARVSSGGVGGTIEVRAGSATGTLLGRVSVPVTGGWETFVDVSTPLSQAPAGATELYLVFTGGSGALFDVDDFTLLAEGGGEGEGDVLVFSRTAGFRHDSIPAGIQAIKDLGFDVTATEDPGAFTTDNLAKYKAVIFLSTTGDVLNDAQQAAFESYIKAGGGFVGVHAAADTEYEWPFYGELVGAWFASHPAIQPATIKVEDRAHPATAHLGSLWNRTDEWYDYRTNARSTAHVLATLDESSYSGGRMGDDHPIAWCKEYEGGRSFYTGGGHTRESFAEPDFLKHLLGGINYAMGEVNADCRPEAGYTSIYNGDTEGWEQAGPGSFANADGTLTSQGGMGLFWYKAKEYGSYSLKLDWKMDGDDNSGVFIGFPASDDPWSAVNNGYEIQIDATDAPDRTTGSVYGFKSADLAARDAALNPPGQWNAYEIRVEGEHLQIFLNGVKINDFTNTDPARSLEQGYVGIQNHGAGDEVAFRNIRIKELTPEDDKAPVTKAALDPAEQPTGWYTAPVTVTLTAADEGSGVAKTEYKVDDGDWAAYTDPFKVDDDGTHKVSFRSTDKAGNQEAAKDVTLKLDATKPELTVGGLTGDGKYGDSAQVTVTAEGKDEGSGIDTVAATLDGEELKLGERLDLSTLALGTHQITVTATDKAGNATEQAVTLTVTTSFGDLATLLGRFEVDGPLGAQLANFLKSASASDVKAHPEQALHHLGKFREAAAKVADENARAVLVRDADALIVLLGGQASAEGTAANGGRSFADLARLTDQVQ
ncbi:ThuA domain-containing protein [Nonomuraea terrae]|uniref:ThuA domain-containing protein n=1 Tax=Nonomuraea terrae TaxID=2530383 RepID=UPI001FE4B129|nr:ThuA domain-containing protein [Nonomuraea terrae]